MRNLSLIILLLALAACAAPVAEVPTTTPAPTATPPPTATPTPLPTATLAPSATPAAAQAGSAINAALARSASADTYRLDLSLRGSGSAVSLGNATAAETELLGMQATFVNDDYEFTLSGVLAVLLGGDPARGIQALRADEQSYVRGPLALVGASDNAWYRLSPEQAALAAPPVSADSSLGAVQRAGAKFEGFTPGPSEQRNGQQCQSYLGDRDATVALLDSLSQSGLPASASPDDITSAESTVVVCADGYLHGLSLTFAGRQGEPAQPFGYSLEVELSDFEAPLVISAPADAREPPAPPGAPGSGVTP